MKLFLLSLRKIVWEKSYFFNCLILKGMNAEEFKYKWGGEDWDLVDRVVNAQLEVERIKYPGLYHHYHTKQEMWS